MTAHPCGDPRPNGGHGIHCRSHFCEDHGATNKFMDEGKRPQEPSWREVADRLYLTLVQNGVGGRAFDNAIAFYQAKDHAGLPRHEHFGRIYERCVGANHRERLKAPPLTECSSVPPSLLNVKGGEP